MKHFLALLCCTVTLVFLLSGCAAKSRGLDVQFGQSGYLAIDFTGTDDQANAVELAPDRSVYAAGYTYLSNNDFAIAKITSAGALDTSFNSTGKATVDFGGSDEAFAILIQSDGKVVAVGQSTVGSTTRAAVARWNQDGSLDTSFGSGGKFTNLVGSGLADYRAAALDSSGRILIAGNALVSGRQRFVLTRLTPAGALDTSFGALGISAETPGTAGDYCRAIALTQNRILLAGTMSVGTGGLSGDFAVVAYSMNGALDTRFGVGGVASFDLGGAIPVTGSSEQRDDTVLTMKVDSANRPLLAGSSKVGIGKKAMAIARLTPLGAIDRTFGKNGANLISAQVRNPSNVLVPIDTEARSLTFGSPGLLLAGQATALNSSNYLSLSQLTPTGSVMAGFGTSGVALIAKETQSTVGTASAYQADGKWLLIGSTYSTSWDFLVVRYAP
jgi:uncharacterized delta-60 repeat protein